MKKTVGVYGKGMKKRLVERINVKSKSYFSRLRALLLY